MSELATDLAGKAEEAYNSGAYETCISSLEALVSRGVSNLHIQLNLALAPYKLSGFSYTAAYRDTLNRLASEHGITIESSITDPTYGYLLYNYALLYYHVCQYQTTGKILQNLLDAIIQHGESVRLRRLLREVCFLLTEISLLLCQSGKALEYIMALEETCGLKTDGKQDDSKQSEYEQMCRYRLQQAKVRCHLLSNNAKGYKKEIKQLGNFSQLQPLKQAFYKGEQELLRGNFRKAVKYVTSVPVDTPTYVDTGDCVHALVLNRLGCIYAKMAKPHLGLMYFNKAFQELAKVHTILRQQANRPLYTVSSLNRLSIMHNLGVMLLHSSQVGQAFDILLEVVQVFHNNPRIWLRLAETCIMAHKSSNQADFKLSQRKPELVRSTIGIGPHRKLILNFAPEPGASGVAELPAYDRQTAVPNLSLDFAALCLKNCLTLLRDGESYGFTMVTNDQSDSSNVTKTMFCLTQK